VKKVRNVKEMAIFGLDMGGKLEKTEMRMLYNG
jgi:hypothetical protein